MAKPVRLYFTPALRIRWEGVAPAECRDVIELNIDVNMRDFDPTGEWSDDWNLDWA